MPDRSADPSYAADWLAVLRIAVGLYFAKAVITKLTIVLAGGVVPMPAVSDRWIATMPKIVEKQAVGNPIGFYKDFLEQTVLTHASLFAHLTAWGETVAGLGLTLGLFTGPEFAEEEHATLPPQIILFLENIWEQAEGDEESFRDEVHTTYLHELGHYLGLDEDELTERGLE